MKEPGNLILPLLQARIIMVHTIFTNLTQHFSTDKWPSFKRAPYWEWQHEIYLIFVIHIQKLGKKKIRRLLLSTMWYKVAFTIWLYNNLLTTPFSSATLLHARNMQLLLDQYSFITPTKKTNSKSNYERRINKKAERHWKKIWGMENRAVRVLCKRICSLFFCFSSILIALNLLPQ